MRQSVKNARDKKKATFLYEYRLPRYKKILVINGFNILNHHNIPYILVSWLYYEFFASLHVDTGTYKLSKHI